MSIFAAPVWGQAIIEDLKLLPSDGAAGANFGTSVAVDGNIAIVSTGSQASGRSAYLFDVNTGGQLFKLLPIGAATNSHFGDSVAISGAFAIVGDLTDDGDGSAWVFSTATGQQLFHFKASDGAANDNFGTSVGISGNIAIVGAPADDDHGSYSGSVYFFDVFTGLELRKVTADNAKAGANFGFSVGIRGTIAVVGTREELGFGHPGPGSAYLFDVVSGGQVAQLMPSDGGVSRDYFGWSVGLGGAPGSEVAIVSKYPTFGSETGKAYVFNRTGTQIASFLPMGGNHQDGFGRSVATDGTTAIVGAFQDDDNGFASGAAYLFDIATGLQTGKIVVTDGAEFDSLGKSVAISNGVKIIGAHRDDDNGIDSGSAYIVNSNLDTDGDGLLDDWETNGIPYTDINDIERRFMLPDADPNHKDLYVEVDAMTGFAMSNGADLQLALAFEASPLDNPDQSNGITLHILRDETTLPHVPVWEIDGCWPVEFDNFRTNSFGTFNERTNVSHVALLEAKAKAYRYCIIADQADDPSTPEFDNIGGCGGIPGDSFVIFIGTGNGGMYSTDGQAAVFMHELGHNLGLQHGGGDSINGKPNYPSIMNYLLTYKSSWSEDFWSLDYSRSDAADLLALDESSLNENVGVGSEDNYYSDYFMPFGVNYDDNGTTIRVIEYVALDGSTADFGDTKGTMFQDDEHDASVVQDLNYAVNPPPGVNLPGVASPGQTLNPHDDWAKITLGLLATGTNRQGTVFPTDELTLESVVWMDENFPAPPSHCLADLTGDGELNFFDVSAFLQAFGNSDPIADFDGDGTFNFFDVSAFLTAFSAGCP